jgi:glycosyltransferase involved in cell wall biosynthesis
MTLSYDIVVTTADRPQILEVSIPTFLDQTRQPARLIIADASDDHDAVASVVRRCTAEAPFEVIVEKAPRGRTIQLNYAMQFVQSPVVIFPDDDSLLYPDAAEHVMRIYERDEADRRIVGGVGLTPVSAPPSRLTDDEQAARRAGTLERLKTSLGLLRFRILASIIPPALDSCGERLVKQHPVPDWLDEVDAFVVPRMIGFRMTFRSEAIRRSPFNEKLWQPRCSLEDLDASLSVARDWLLLESRKAKVYHHKVGGRTVGIVHGVQQLLNAAYITCRFSEPGSPERRAMRRYAQIFMLESVLLRAPFNKGERQRLKGMWRAYRRFGEMYKTPTDQLDERYRQLMTEALA